MSSSKPKQPESNLSASRKELVARLGACLDQLQKFIATPYAGASSLDCWPTVGELNELSGAVMELGRTINIKKVDFDHVYKIMRHVDRRYPKLGLLAFFEGLVRKIESIPVGPVTRIKLELDGSIDDIRRKQLLIILGLLNRYEWKIEAEAGLWKKLGPLLFELSGGQIKELREKSRPSTMQEIDFKQADKMFGEPFGLAAFLEVQRQHLVWRMRWDQKVLPVATWLYLVMNRDWDLRLRRIIYNPNITPVVSKADDKKLQEREKKRKHRKKKPATSEFTKKREHARLSRDSLSNRIHAVGIRFSCG